MDYKNIGLKKPQNFNFSKGVSPQFDPKFEILITFVLWKMHRQKIYFDNLVIKQAFLHKKTWI